ncbi:MAG TPA: hypothetical protein PKD00_00810 [Burkholderiales bacterium]|nr:hypothetical protein [Burkholderiales bacterium]
MKKIGTFTVSYNRNTNTLYSVFNPTIEEANKDSVMIEENCEECTEKIIKEKLEETTAAWFTKVGNLEESDIAEFPTTSKLIDEKYFKDGRLKFRKYEIYKDFE